MSYTAPFIDSAGLHISGYPDIDSYEIQQFLSVYGQTVSTGKDQSDIQWISIFSLMIADAFQTGQLAYNARSPLTAVGSDLDAICTIIGIARKPATASTAVLTIGGTPNTVIANGVVQDVNGNLWSLPPNVTIPASGSVNVTATCVTIGAIDAQQNTIKIQSSGLTKGWLTQTNPAAATAGLPVENDSQLRARYFVSVGISSKTLVTGTLAGIAAVPNVTRYAKGTQTLGGQGTSIENPTGVTDSWGNPPHSISMVVEGGTDLDVATAIYNNKTPGCLTNGTTTVPVTDPNTLVTMNISFFRPTTTPIFATLAIKKQSGYTTSITASIQAGLTTYLNSLQIGEFVSVSALSAVAMANNPVLTAPVFSVTSCVAGTTSGGQSTADIPINFNAVAQGVSANIILTVS